VNLGALLKSKPATPQPRAAFHALLDKRTPQLAKLVQGWLTREGTRIAAEVLKLYTVGKADLGVLLSKATKPKQSTADIAAQLDLSSWTDLAGIVTDDTEQVFRDAYEEGLNVYGITDLASTDQMDEEAHKWALERAAEIVGKKIDEDGNVVDNPAAEWSITESTRDTLRGIITQAVEDGASPAKLKQAIEDSTAFSDTRASTIARTELASAYIQGNKAGWEGAGVASKQSIVGSEHDRDDECDEAADDGAIPMDELFSNGMDAPPYHPNCICDLLPVLDDAEKMLKGDVPGHEFHGNQWTGEAGKALDHVTLYHGTSASNVKSILKTGISAQDKKNYGAEMYGTDRETSVYVTGSENSAFEYGENSAANNGESDFTVIELEIPSYIASGYKTDELADDNSSKRATHIDPKWIKRYTTFKPVNTSGHSTKLMETVVEVKKSITTTSLSKLITDDQADQAAPHLASPSQLSAGNYKKGHMNINGLDISIENPAGSHRRPEWPPLKHHYGYIKGTVGNDGDQVDVFVKAGISEDYDGHVYVVNQKKADGTFDEHKVMLGWDDPHHAEQAYLENYTPGWDRIMSINKYTFPEFKQWINNF
jgi:hypothetical protein